LKDQLLDAARRDNLDLLNSILPQLNNNQDDFVDLINNSRDTLGNTALHLATIYGNFEIIDSILNYDNIEIDPINNLNNDSPLHLAITYSFDDFNYGKFLAETLIDAGSDPRIKNRFDRKPIDLLY
ncbi:ankyrin repeat-containing protein ANK1 ASCRUDRAFT_17917, partial [Ascoidea rubescens DSM 1968]